MQALRWLIPLIVTFAALAGPARADDISAAARGVVRVVIIAEADGTELGRGHGSGFAVAPNRIVTNAHVVARAKGDTVRVSFADGRSFTGTVIGRDLIVVTGSALLYATIGNVKVNPLFLSKVALVLQMVTIGWVLCKFSPLGTFWLAAVAVTCTTISGLLYVRDGIRQFSEHPVAHPNQAENKKESDRDA